MADVAPMLEVSATHPALLAGMLDGRPSGGQGHRVRSPLNPSPDQSPGPYVLADLSRIKI